MSIDDRLLKIIRKRYNYSDTQVESFRRNPRNEEVLNKLNELNDTVLVLTVVDSHGCNSQHKIGDKIYFDGAGNILTQYCPNKICSYAIHSALLMIFTANEFLYSGISPSNIKFKRSSCFDVGVNCGGLGQIILELSVINKKELPNKNQTMPTNILPSGD